jgi:catecholate siderophore receptor
MVTATPVAGGAAVTAVTDQHGEFALALPAGTFTVTIESVGFRLATQRVNASRPGDGPREFVLQVAGFQETVNVNAPKGYNIPAISSATRTSTPLRDVPQSVTVITPELMRDQQMTSIADVVRYVPGIAAHQGENNRDDVVIRGNRSSADFFLNGIRDDVQYYRDLYNLDRVEALKGRTPWSSVAATAAAPSTGWSRKRCSCRCARSRSRPAVTTTSASAATSISRSAGRWRSAPTRCSRQRQLPRRREPRARRVQPDAHRHGHQPTKLTFGYEHLRDERVADRGITSFQGRPADVAIDTFYGNQRDSHVEAHVNIGTINIEHRVGRAILGTAR